LMQAEDTPLILKKYALATINMQATKVLEE
jgi:hypothetical protein